MKTIHVISTRPKEEFFAFLSDNRKVNDGVSFPEKTGTPQLRIRQKGNFLRARITLIGGPTKDNGFLQGTAFYGTLKEKNGGTDLCGVICTEPVFHLLWLALIANFVYSCIARGGFSIVPVCLIVFVYGMMFKEYKKQDTLKRYLYRAAMRLEKKYE